MTARMPSPSRPSVKPATGILLFWSVMSSLFRASMPPVKRTSMVFSATPVAGSGTIFLDHLIDRHAGGDHGVDVRLGVDVEVQYSAAFPVLRPPHGRLDIVALADGAPGEPVRGGELLVVGTGYGRLRIAAVVEELLPLADHPQVSVVQNGDLYVQPEVPYRGELLDVHLDAAVAGYDPDGIFRIGESHPHGRWQREAHRAEAPARDVAVGLGELEELGGPHLVLPHVGDDPQIRASGSLYGLHHLYGTVLVPRGLLAAPLRLLARYQFLAPVPATFALIGGVIKVSEDRTHRGFGVSGDAYGRLYDLAELGGVDVDVDDLRALGELVDRARDPVVEAHPDGEKEVGAVYGAVDAGLPVHPRPAQVQRMVVGEGAYAEERRHHGDARPLREQPELHLGVTKCDAVSGQDQGPLRVPEEHGGPLESRRLHRRRRLLETPVAVVVRGRQLHVLGHVDEDGSWPSAAGDLESPPHRRVELVGILDQEGVLGEGQRHAHDVRLLERVLAHRRSSDLARDRHQRHRIHLGRRQPRDQVGRPWPARGHAHPDPTRRPRVAVRRVGGSLFVAGEDVFQRVIGEGVVERHDRAPRVAEEVIDPLVE